MKKFITYLIFFHILTSQNMGTNWYIDNGSEGDFYENLPHIGKFTFRDGKKHFIFYMSKEFQYNRLFSLDETINVVSEEGQRKTIAELSQELFEIPFLEQAFEFF